MAEKCSMPTDTARMCRRDARYFYMRGTAIEDQRVVGQYCRQHASAGGRARILRPASFEYDGVYDKVDRRYRSADAHYRHLFGIADAPEPGKVYRLTGGPDDDAISNGNSWAESEVKPTPEAREAHSLRNLPDDDDPSLAEWWAWRNAYIPGGE